MMYNESNRRFHQVEQYVKESLSKIHHGAL